MKNLHLVIATLLLGSFSLKAEMPSFKISADTKDALRGTANKSYAIGLRGMAVTAKGLMLVPALSLLQYGYLQKRSYSYLRRSRIQNQGVGIETGLDVNENMQFLRKTPNHIAITTTHLLAMHYLNKLSLFLHEKANAVEQAKTA